MTRSNIPADWQQVLGEAFVADRLMTTLQFVDQQRAQNKLIYPAAENTFQALQLTPFDKVKVIILGQDPYHGPNQAHGLSFSVPDGVRIPPSLRNIFKELRNDLGIDPAPHGNLQAWAEQGVLLLNAVLSVEGEKPGSHAKMGWEEFTDQIIAQLSAKKSGLVFVLWGAYAQKKAALIDGQKHFILSSVHPSPLSASRGFLGSRPFSKINEYLVGRKNPPIEWRLPAN